MATEKWVAGALQGLTWGNAFTGSTLNSIASGNAILSDLALANGGSNLDMFADVSFRGASVTTTGTPFIAIYIYPLLDDGSTYGDGRFGSSAAGPPPGSYQARTADGGPAAFGLPVGTQIISGAIEKIIIPPGTFKFLLHNGAGVALAGSGNVCLYRSYNRQVS